MPPTFTEKAVNIINQLTTELNSLEVCVCVCVCVCVYTFVLGYLDPPSPGATGYICTELQF